MSTLHSLRTAAVNLVWGMTCLAILVSSMSIARPGLSVGGTAKKTFLEYPKLNLSSSELSTPNSRPVESTEQEKRLAEFLMSKRDSALNFALTEELLTGYVKHKIMPTRGARGLALTHVAMHDAAQLSTAAELKSDIALVVAFAHLHGYLFPAEEGYFLRVAKAYVDLCVRIVDEKGRAGVYAANDIGKTVGLRSVEFAEQDGAQRGWSGSRLQFYGESRHFGPGTWEPTAPYFYYPPDEPFAPTWRTWVLRPTSKFRPTPPPTGSKQQLEAVLEVIQVQKNLTNDQRRVAQLWVDGHGSVTPPGHWTQIAIKVCEREKCSRERASRLLAILAISLADTFVAVWDVKYFFWTARPITVISAIRGVPFEPLLLTPPFPSYVSGHAAISAAAAEVLGDYFPSQKAQLLEMAAEAAYSRLLGGIHFRYDNEDGARLGAQVAREVLSVYGSE